MSIADACLHASAANGWQQYYLTLAQRLCLSFFSARLHLLFVNKLNRVKFITKICIALTALYMYMEFNVTVYGVFTAAVQLPHMYDSFGDLND